MGKTWGWICPVKWEWEFEVRAIWRSNERPQWMGHRMTSGPEILPFLSWTQSRHLINIPWAWQFRPWTLTIDQHRSTRSSLGWNPARCPTCMPRSSGRISVVWGSNSSSWCPAGILCRAWCQCSSWRQRGKDVEANLGPWVMYGFWAQPHLWLNRGHWWHDACESTTQTECGRILCCPDLLATILVPFRAKSGMKVLYCSHSSDDYGELMRALSEAVIAIWPWPWPGLTNRSSDGAVVCGAYCYTYITPTKDLISHLGKPSSLALFFSNTEQF